MPESGQSSIRNQEALQPLNNGLFPVLIPLRPGWLPVEGGVQVNVGWSGEDLRILPPFSSEGGSSSTSLPTMETFFWNHNGSSLLNILPRDLASLPPLLEWIEAGVLYGHTCWDSFLISSPEIPFIRALRFLRPNHEEIRIGFSMPPDFESRHDDLLELAHALGVQVIQGDLSRFDASLVESIQNLEFRILAENVNGLVQIRHALSLGMDGITTEQPEHSHAVINRLRRHQNDT